MLSNQTLSSPLCTTNKKDTLAKFIYKKKPQKYNYKKAAKGGYFYNYHQKKKQRKYIKRRKTKKKRNLFYLCITGQFSNLYRMQMDFIVDKLAKTR